MAKAGPAVGITATLAVCGAFLLVPALAHAQTAASKTKAGFTADVFATGQPPSPDASQYTGQTIRNVIQWEGAGRWGLKLQLDETVSRAMQPKDVEAGAFYKLTPSLRVGGAVGVTNTPSASVVSPKAAEDKAAPRVRLETSFKF